MARPLLYPPRTGSERRGGSEVILHPHRPEWFVANHSATEIAQRLMRGEPPEDVALCLSDRYELPPDVAHQDVRAVALQLERCGFTPCDTTAPSRSPSLLALFIHLTTRCNLPCQHCYYPSRSNADLPAAVVIRLIDELAEEGGELVTLSGGEPLLHPDIVPILKHAVGKTGIQILTNGTQIDEDWASFLAGEIRPAIQVSLDGSDEETNDAIRGRGSFKRTMQALESLQNAGLGDMITLAATVMKQNLHDQKRIVGLAERLGIPRVRFLPLRKVGNAEKHWQSVGASMQIEDYESLFDLSRPGTRDAACSVAVTCGLSGFILKMPQPDTSDGIWCPVGNSLVIGVDSDAFPCVLMMRDEFKLGNVIDDGTSRLIRSPKMMETCKALASRRNTIERCRPCTWKNLCQAGCMGQALDNHGTIFETDAFCNYRRRAYQLAFDRILDKFDRASSAD
ncbi:MAG: PqqD family peptide modification chaperone [Acidobacteriota bacterium]